ncbi:MAG TPA: hydroxymethylglutaryl-CoA lyase [Thermoanaerobaculia bacterium]|nr:hydroxymethylglutaryl-CoA lyase [Thermoanaerobaculia bacterium]
MKITVDAVKIVEVGPRDGLQNEKVTLPTQAKVDYITALGDAGLRVIEAGAFVSPKWVPQMADTAEVYRNIPKDPGVEYPVLVPNEKGLDRALEAGVKSIAIFTAASETFNKRNINMSIDESILKYAPVAVRARAEGLRVRGYVSTGFGCPYEGDVPPERVLEVCARLLDLGCYEVSVGDTIGVGTPLQVQGVIGLLLHALPVSKLAMHFHDTRGTALANTVAALEMGIATFDASSGGLGGCPYAPGASGNLATEDLVYMLDKMGIETGVDLNRLVKASSMLAPYLDHPLPGRYLQACTKGTLPFATQASSVESSDTIN